MSNWPDELVEKAVAAVPGHSSDEEVVRAVLDAISDDIVLEDKGQLESARTKLARLRHQVRFLQRQRYRTRQEINRAISEIRAGTLESAVHRLSVTASFAAEELDTAFTPVGARRKQRSKRLKAQE